MAVRIWKRIALLLLGILQSAVFLGLWLGLIFRETIWGVYLLWGCVALLVLCLLFHLILPILRMFR